MRTFTDDQKLQCTAIERGRRCTNLCNPDSESSKAGAPRCKHHPQPGKRGPHISLEGNEPSYLNNVRYKESKGECR